MRIRLHAQTFAGQPLPNTGPSFEAPTAAELVEQMRLDSPFSAAQSPADYCATVLKRIERGPAQPLPTDPAQRADAFLTRCQQAGFLTWEK